MSVVSDSSGQKSVRSHFDHPRKIGDYIRFQLGIADGEKGFDRFFLAETAFMFLLYEVEEFVKRKMLFSKKPMGTALDPVHLQQIRQIWHGPTWMVVRRDPIHNAKVLWRKIAYKRINPTPELDVLRIPALKNLNPVDQIKSEKFLLRMREPGKVPDLLGGIDYRQVVLQGKYYIDYLNNRKPIFTSQQDVEGSKAITMSAGRRWFHAMINFEGMAYWSKRVPLYADLCQILDDDMRKGFEESKEENFTPREFVELK